MSERDRIWKWINKSPTFFYETQGADMIPASFYDKTRAGYQQLCDEGLLRYLGPMAWDETRGDPYYEPEDYVERWRDRYELTAEGWRQVEEASKRAA